MNLARKVRMFGLSSAALRAIGMLFVVAGMVGALIQRSILGVGGMANTQLLEAMQANPDMMVYATVALAFQALEACAVPIFAFLLVEGTTHTVSFRNYFLRVLGLAAVCQLPYNVITTGSLLMIGGLNPVFALVFSMVMLYFFRRFPEKKAIHILLKTCAILFAFLWSNMLGVSHGAACVILTAVLWALRGKQNLQTFIGIAVMICCSIFDLFYMVAPVSFLILHFYDGERGADSKLVNYLAYPVCLIVFCVLTKTI